VAGRKRQLYRTFALCLAISLSAGCFDFGPLPAMLWPELTLESPLAKPLQIGVAAAPITPAGPTFLAGGIPYRLALNVHDDIWARAVVVDDGTVRLALVALDLIGISYDQVVLIRQDIAGRVDVDYVLIAATHTHNAPDLIGVWAPFPSCADSAYRKFVGRRVADAVAEAVQDIRPAYLHIAAGDSGDPPLSRDTRPPDLIDDTLTVWQARDARDGEVIATVVHYASHPILVPSFNFDISSDFVHYLREGIESEVGGVCVFFNGALGGRIVPSNTGEIEGSDDVEEDYRKAHAYGHRLGERALQLLRQSAKAFDAPMILAVHTRQARVPLDNALLQFAASRCIVARSAEGNMVNTEVAIVRIGPMALFAVPGMIFPELVLGGFSAVPGSDFPEAAVEAPPLAELADQPYVVTVGMANDMLGYIIPKVLWDAGPPFTTGGDEGPYGELISPGPDTAAIIINAFAELAGRR